MDEFIARTGLQTSLNAPTNFFSGDHFLAKRSQASVGILGDRNALIANAFHQVSEWMVGNAFQPDAGDFVASTTIKQTGASVLWTWRLTSQNAWNSGGAYTRNEFPGMGRIDNITYVGMGLNRQFQPRLFDSLNYRRQRGDSNKSEFNYTENVVFARLIMRF